MRTFTKKELSELSDLRFAKIVLQNLLDKRSNTETPIAQKLRSAISTLSLLIYEEEQEAKGISKARAIQIAQQYIDQDAEAAESSYVLDSLRNICDDEEIKQLGFGWLLDLEGKEND